MFLHPTVPFQLQLQSTLRSSLAAVESATSKLPLGAEAVFLSRNLVAAALALVDTVELLADLTSNSTAGASDGSSVAKV